MKKVFIFVGILTLLFVSNVFGQIVPPRESNRQEIAQTVGDSKISIVYHRPNAKGRNIYDCESTDFLQKGNGTYPCMVPKGQVWRTGANENTTIEFSTDVSINGQPLKAGKYAFFAIPDKTDWTLVFSKKNDAWGAFTYDAKDDALRVKVAPQKSSMNRETLMYEFDSVKDNSTNVVLSWEKLMIPFTVNVGDFNGRVLGQFREAIKNAKADDFRTPAQGASFVLNTKQSASYEEAVGWADKSIAVRETFGNLAIKANLLNAMGKTKEAIETGDKAVQVGKAATPAVNTTAFEKTLADWKAKK